MSERYPIVTDIVPSQATVGILKNLLFGQDGVLTAHLSYLYQSWLIGAQNQIVGDYFYKLAQNDGEILNALGNIAVAFGGDPAFTTTNEKYWAVQYLILTKNQQLLFKNLINLENRAISDLDYAISNIDNESLKTLLTSIKEDKEKIVVDLQNLQQSFTA